MKHGQKKLLDWHLEDIEQRFGFKGSKYTDVNTWFAVIITVVVTGVLFIGLQFLPEGWRSSYGVEIILERGWTPYVMMIMSILAFAILYVKSCKLRFQEKAFQIEVIPAGSAFALTSDTAHDTLRRLNSFVDDPKRFVLFNRIERALLNLRNVGNLSDVSEMLRAQAENDESHMDSSYGLLHGIIWGIPILGFIGTVIGLSGAIGRFGTVLNADASVSSLKEGLAPVTNNLGIAFDTTFLALVLAMIIQLSMTILRKKEELFFDACRDYAHVNIISRLRLRKEDVE